MAIEAGDVLWTVRADTRSLKAGMRDAKVAGDKLASGFMRNSKAIGAAMTIAGAAITAMFAGAAGNAASFQKEMARVATLGVKDLGAIEKTVKDLSVAFGLDLKDGAKAAYQAISAGASEVEVPKVLEAAAKAATAGFTDLTTAIDLGMGVLNAFGGELKDVNAVFDLTFLAIKNGVTDFEQLAAGIGDIAPLFKAAGIGADEMFAAISAITLGGVKTNKALTGLKGAVVGILKPTEDMKKLFEDLGGPMAAIEKIGFEGFLQRIQTETAGAKDQLALLFGSVEGLGAVLSLTGSAAQDFADGLAESRLGTSALDEAFDLFIEANPAFAFEQLKAVLSLLSVEIGKELLPSLITMARGIKDAIVGVLAWKDANPLAWKTIIILAAGVGVLMLALGPLIIALPAIAAGVSLLGVASGGAAIGVGALAIAASALAFLGIGALVIAASAGLLAIGAFALETVRLGQALLQVKTSGDAVDAGLLKLIASYERSGTAIDKTRLAGLKYQAALDEINKQVEAQRGKQRDANAEQAKAVVALNKSTDALGNTTTATGESTEAIDIHDQSLFKAIGMTGQFRGMNFKLTTVLQDVTEGLDDGTDALGENAGALDSAAGPAWNTGAAYFNVGSNANFAAAGIAAMNRELAKTPKGGNFASGGVVKGFAAGGVIPGFAQGGRIVQVGEAGPELAFLPVGTNILNNSDSKQAVADAVRANGPISMTATFGDIIVQGSENPQKTAREIVDSLKVEMGRQFREAQATF